MKFTHRIMLSPLVTAVAFICIFLLTQRAAERSSETIARIQDEVFHATELSQELQIDLLTIRHLLTEAATNGNEDSAREADRIAARFRTTLDSCRDVPALAAMLEPVGRDFNGYYGQARATTALMIGQAGNLTLDFDPELFAGIGEMNRRYEALSDRIDVVVRENNAALGAAIEDIRGRVSRLRWVLNLTSLVFLVLLVVLSVVGISSVVRPVHRMSRVAQAISGGDLGKELTYRSPDALGELADSIREMQASLIRDIARREQAEADLIAAQGQMIQSEKMAVLGKLVAGIAHELNTPLGSLGASVDLVERSRRIIVDRCADRPDAADDVRLAKAVRALEQGLENMAVANTRIGELVNGLKVFSQLDKGEVQQADINAGLDATLDLIGHEIPAGVAVRRELGELPRVLGFPAQLNQAFLSLIRHAIRDTAPEGEVTVRTETRGEKVRVVISDTGCGYQPDALLALFNPSFKADTSRMRMDWEMVTASRIVDRHQGTLTAKSDPGRGTRYTVEIPVWSQPIRAAAEGVNDR